MRIYLIIIAHNERIHIITESFRYLRETICRHFRKVLKAITCLSKEIIIPSNLNKIVLDIWCNPKYYIYIYI